MQVANITLINANLGQDPELKQTNGGLDFLKFSCAVNTKRGNQDRTAWYSCTVWGKQALTLAPLLHKGSTVCVTGRLDPREYEAKDGTTRTSLDVSASDVILTGPKEDRPTRQQPDDDIPF